jgi:hypothetical protein
VKPFLFISLFAISAFSGSNFYKTISIGASAAVGNDFDNVFIAPGGGIDLNYKVHKNIGIGSHLDYSWFAFRNRLNYDYFNVGIHCLDLAFVPRGYVPIDEYNELFFEVDPALALTYVYIDYVDFSQNTYRDDFLRKDFGMTYGLGVSMRFFTVMCKLKMVYLENSENTYDSRKYLAARWIMVTIGVPLAG